VSSRNTAASVRARLLAKARTDKQDFNLVLTRYALERQCYRLSISAHTLLFKGALLRLNALRPHCHVRNLDAPNPDH